VDLWPIAGQAPRDRPQSRNTRSMDPGSFVKLTSLRPPDCAQAAAHWRSPASAPGRTVSKSTPAAPARCVKEAPSVALVHAVRVAKRPQPRASGIGRVAIAPAELVRRQQHERPGCVRDVPE
jgi:hypothetical protein